MAKAKGNKYYINDDEEENWPELDLVTHIGTMGGAFNAPELMKEALVVVFFMAIANNKGENESGKKKALEQEANFLRKLMRAAQFNR